MACPIPLMLLLEACENGEPIPVGVAVDEKDAGQYRREMKLVDSFPQFAAHDFR